MPEETVFHAMDLPDGEDWAWFPDLNVVGLRRGLDWAGKLRAIDELQRHWHGEHLRLVVSA